MIFEYIRFKNYRPYYDSQTILFRQEHKKSPYRKNIVLVGGLNGAGKTSLINSIFICLYGRRWFKKEEYDHIRYQAINDRYQREGGREGSIELCFTDQQGKFLIQVSWHIQSADVIEKRELFKLDENDEKTRWNLSDEEFNDFIDQRIPLDVAPFFFFNAEKIGELVGTQEQPKTAEAIQKIVSLDLYRKLKDDLIAIRTQEEKNIAKLVKNNELKLLNTQLQKHVNEYEKLKKEDEENRKGIPDLEARKKRLEQLRTDKLAANSKSKMKISSRIGALKSKLEINNNEIEKFRSNLWRLVLDPLVGELKNAITKEQDYLAAISKEIHAFSKFDEFMADLLKAPIKPPLEITQKQELITHGKNIWAKLNRIQQLAVNSKIPLLHDLSQSDSKKLLDWSAYRGIDLKDKLDLRYRLQNELEQLNRELETAPDAVDTQEENAEIDKISHELGRLYEANRQRNRILKQLKDKITDLRNEITRKRKQLTDVGPAEKKLDLINQLVSATNDFIKAVTILKAEQLKSEVEDILNRIFRKREFDRIELNDQYALRIYNEHNQKIDLNARSEGEKQLIALSIIWALTKVSGMDLPFVIDTPLARLDSIHRSNLVQEYFTNLSEQVVILSTDTEVTKEFVEEINPYVNGSYLLIFDDAKKVTRIEPGYFQFED